MMKRVVDNFAPTPAIGRQAGKAHGYRCGDETGGCAGCLCAETGKGFLLGRAQSGVENVQCSSGVVGRGGIHHTL